MGHSIRGFVGRPGVLQAICTRFPAAKLVHVDAGFALVPGTRSLLAAIDGAEPGGERLADAIDFLFDHPVMQRALTELSRGGPIAFVETDYFEGRGAQAATAFVNGEAVAAKEGKEGEGWPINEALRAIGVVRASDEDEFDTVCLGKFRSMRDFE